MAKVVKERGERKVVEMREQGSGDQREEGGDVGDVGEKRERMLVMMV